MKRPLDFASLFASPFASLFARLLARSRLRIEKLHLDAIQITTLKRPRVARNRDNRSSEYLLALGYQLLRYPQRRHEEILQLFLGAGKGLDRHISKVGTVFIITIGSDRQTKHLDRLHRHLLLLLQTKMAGSGSESGLLANSFQSCLNIHRKYSSAAGDKRYS